MTDGEDLYLMEVSAKPCFQNLTMSNSLQHIVGVNKVIQPEATVSPLAYRTFHTVRNIDWDPTVYFVQGVPPWSSLRQTCITRTTFEGLSELCLPTLPEDHATTGWKGCVHAREIENCDDVGAHSSCSLFTAHIAAVDRC